MKKIFTRGTFVVSCGLVGVALLSAHTVQAGLVTHISGTICKPSASGDRADISYTNYGAENVNTSSPRAVVCGLPMKYSIGKTLSYDFNVIDKSSTDAVRCNVVALNTSNNVVYASAETPSGNGVPTFTGFVSMPVASPEFANEDATQRHYAVCTLPKATNAQNRSGVLGIRLY